MENRKLRVRLDIVWQNDNDRHRYIPKSLDGGTGWSVWDKAHARFLSDKEVIAKPKDDLVELWQLN